MEKEVQDVLSFWWWLWKIIGWGNKWHCRMMWLWTKIQFKKIQTCPCLKIIHIVKSIFWWNDPTSFCWVDEVGNKNDKKIYDVNGINEVPSHEAMEYLSILNSFNNIWDRRKKKGNTYGDNFITRFKDDIYETFERGGCEKGENMTAYIM